MVASESNGRIEFLPVPQLVFEHPWNAWQLHPWQSLQRSRPFPSGHSIVDPIGCHCRLALRVTFAFAVGCCCSGHDDHGVGHGDPGDRVPRSHDCRRHGNQDTLEAIDTRCGCDNDLVVADGSWSTAGSGGGDGGGPADRHGGETREADAEWEDP